MTTIDAKTFISALSNQGSTGNLSKSPAVTDSSAVESVSSSANSSLQPTDSDLQQAAQQIQSYLSGQTDPPQYVVDYLSGLQVMTVRSASNGEVVFQLPDADALRLAQMLREGSSVGTVGIVDAQA